MSQPRTQYRVEIANRIWRGRAVGTEYVVVHPHGSIVRRCATRAEAQQHCDALTDEYVHTEHMRLADCLATLRKTL